MLADAWERGGGVRLGLARDWVAEIGQTGEGRGGEMMDIVVVVDCGCCCC